MSSEFKIPILGNFTAAAQTLDLTSPNSGTSIIQVNGTWSGTIILEGSNDETNWTVLSSLNNSTKLLISSISASGIYIGITNGFRALRLRVSAWTSGTAAVSVYGSDFPSVLTTDSFLRGATDGSLIGNIGDRLKTDSNINFTTGQLIPTMTNKFRVRYSVTPATVGAAYSTLYTRSGTGLFFGFQTDFNSQNVRLKITIDGTQLVEITVADLKTFQFNDTSTTRMQVGGFWTTVGNTVDFSLKFAIPYTTGVLIEMQRTDGSDHQMSRYMIFLTEDT